MSIKPIKFTLLAIAFFISLQVYATPVECPTSSSDNSKVVTLDDIKSTPKLITTDKQRKSKPSSSYFGLFKMLIPNTSK